MLRCQLQNIFKQTIKSNIPRIIQILKKNKKTADAEKLKKSRLIK